MKQSFGINKSSLKCKLDIFRFFFFHKGNWGVDKGKNTQWNQKSTRKDNLYFHPVQSTRLAQWHKWQGFPQGGIARGQGWNCLWMRVIQRSETRDWVWQLVPVGSEAQHWFRLEQSNHISNSDLLIARNCLCWLVGVNPPHTRCFDWLAWVWRCRCRHGWHQQQIHVGWRWRQWVIGVAMRGYTQWSELKSSFVNDLQHTWRNFLEHFFFLQLFLSLHLSHDS